MIMLSDNVRMGAGGINQYVDHIEWAAGAYWVCDAERANERKAKDIRGHIADAVKQFPENKKCVVHAGMDTPDGADVELERFQRMVTTMGTFNPDGKDLRWVFAHLFESYAPPVKASYIDETVYKFGANRPSNPDPLFNHNAVSEPSDGEKIINGVHWLREAP